MINISSLGEIISENISNCTFVCVMLQDMEGSLRLVTFRFYTCYINYSICIFCDDYSSQKCLFFSLGRHLNLQWNLSIYHFWSDTWFKCLHLQFSYYDLQVNTHLTPCPILLTRHGESRDNVRGRIGGDSVLR